MYILKCIYVGYIVFQHILQSTLYLKCNSHVTYYKILSPVSTTRVDSPS